MISKNYKPNTLLINNKNSSNNKQAIAQTSIAYEKTQNKRLPLQSFIQTNQNLNQQIKLKRIYPDHPSLSKKQLHRLQQLKRKYTNKGKQNEILKVKQKKNGNFQQKQQKRESKNDKCQALQRINVKQTRIQKLGQRSYEPTSIHTQQQSLKIEKFSYRYIQNQAQNKLQVQKKAQNYPQLIQPLLKAYQLDQFKGKVSKVNSGIQSKLDYLQSKLKELRSHRKKQQQQQCYSQKQEGLNQFQKLVQKQKFTSPYTKYNETNKYSSPQIKVQRNRLAQYATQLAESKIVDIQTKKQQRSAAQFMLKQRQKFLQRNFFDQVKESEKHQQKQVQQDIGQTRLKIDLLQLKGKFQRKITKDFTTFINRLSHQIQIDTEFTINLSKYHNIQVSNGKQTNNLLIIVRQKVKSMTNHYPIAYQDEILEIRQMQLDPLQNSRKTQIKPIAMSSQQILSVAIKIRDEYIKIQEFFYRKLHKKFKAQVIDILLDQLKQIYSVSENEINIGHLTSYLNMRTGNEFRNRNMFKLLKRLKMQENILKIDKKVLTKLFLFLA